MSPNDQLANLYASKWDDLCRILHGVEGASQPLLLQLDESYFEMSPRLMVVGQETFGWCGAFSPSVDFEHLYQVYRSVLERHPTPFWRVVRQVLQAVSPGATNRALAWSNLNWIDIGQKRPVAVEAELASLGIVRNEIEILQPDILLFLTGPHYDPLLEHITGCSQVPISGFDQRRFCRIAGPVLPFRAFRTDHPQYLLRTRRVQDAITAILTH